MKNNSLILLLTVVLCLPILSFAETIVLKSGQKVEGKIIEKTDKYIKIDFQGIPITYFIDEIERIDKNSSIIKTYEGIASQADKESKESLEKNPSSTQALNDRGIAYRMNGDQEKAIECFTRAIEIDSTNAESYSHRGMSYANSKVKKWDLALADFNKAIELDPQNGEYYFNRSAGHYRLQDFDNMWKDIKKAESLGFKIPSHSFQQIKKESLQYYNKRGYDAAQNGNLDSAIFDYNKAIEIDPNIPLIYANRANAYSNKRLFDEAVADYKKALEINPKDDKVYHDLGMVYVNKGDFDQAISYFNKSLEVNPAVAKIGQFYNDRAIAYFWKKEYDKCWDDVNKAIGLGYQVHPEFLKELKKTSGNEAGQDLPLVKEIKSSQGNNSVSASNKTMDEYLESSKEYFRRGNLSLAISDLTKAIEINPDYADAYNNRGFVYIQQGNLPQAISDFNKAIEINPNFADAYSNRGSVYGMQGNLTQAIFDYNKAIEINPNYAAAYYNRGLFVGMQGNFTQSVSDFTKAIEINPNYAAAYNNRGFVYIKQGNLPQAISDLTKAIEINPKLAEAYSNRGSVYGMQSNFTQAIFDYNKAIEINPNFADAYLGRGFAYDKQSNFTQAIFDYNKAIEINPNFADTYEGRAYSYFARKEYEKAWNDIHKAEALGYKADKEDLEFLDKLKKASGRNK